MESKQLDFYVKTYDKLYLARLALTTSRYTPALALISEHVTQGFERDHEGQLSRVIVPTGNQIKAKSGDRRGGEQRYVLYDKEEIEIYSEIVKRYVDCERRAARKLRKVGVRLNDREV